MVTEPLFPLERITGRILLVGEGIDEARSFEAMCSAWQIADVCIASYGGKSRLRAFLDFLPVLDGYQSLQTIIVTRDADGDYAGAVDSLKTQLRNAGYSPPNDCGDLSAGSPRAGIFVFPGPNSPGALEDLVLQTFSAVELGCVDAFLSCGSALGLNPREPSKARIQAWLALREDTIGQVGVAFRSGLIDLTHAAFSDFRQLLEAAKTSP